MACAEHTGTGSEPEPLQPNASKAIRQPRQLPDIGTPLRSRPLQTLGLGDLGTWGLTISIEVF